MKNYSFLIFLALITILVLPGMSYAKDEEVVLESAKEVINIWQQHLDKGIDIINFSPKDNYWFMRRIIGGRISYDVKRTDSLVSPYKLIIYVNNIKYKENINGPGANGYYSKDLNKIYGYKSKLEALNKVSKMDFTCQGNFDFIIFYAFQDNGWVLKGGDTYFEGNFFSHETGYRKEDIAVLKEASRIEIFK
ncbi:MAG: hypothetical protein SVS15_02100 [Thermodesulfobacteriota bacterium]|nr:hypothetical protein [Thermodesulfobacteriota bacterium]